MFVCLSVYKRTKARPILVVYLVTQLASWLCSDNSKGMKMNTQQWYKCHYAPTNKSFLKLLICTPALSKQSTGIFASTGIAPLTFVIKLPHIACTLSGILLTSYYLQSTPCIAPPLSTAHEVCEQKFPIILTLGTIDIAPSPLTAIRRRRVTDTHVSKH